MSVFDAYGLAVVVISVLYAALLVWFSNGWNSIESFVPKRKVLQTKVSVIVPFFNEINTLEITLKSLLSQHIQTIEYEIICVDDHSTDGSSEVAKKLDNDYRRLHYLLNSNNGKKEALESGIRMATGNLIITTDADCLYQHDWLHSIVEYYEDYDPDMIIGPVVFSSEKGLFQKFQKLEFSSLVGTGAGAAGINHAIMCNGANLAFKRDIYDQLNDPFNKEFLSGDDVFLLHNFKALNTKIDFLKCSTALVETQPSKSINEFVKQRIRWASKAGGYKDGDTLFVSIIIFAVSCLLTFSLLLLFVDFNYWKPLVFLYLFKTLIDGYFFYKISDYFKIKSLLKWVPIFQIFYVIYVTVIGVLSVLTSGKSKSTN